MSAPIDLSATNKNMRRPRNAVYHSYILAAMKAGGEPLEDKLDPACLAGAAREVAKPKGAGARASWKCLPANAEERDEMSIRDRMALVLAIAERLRANDASWLHLVDVNWKAADSLVDSQKTTFAVPGLRAVNLAVYTKRTRG